MKILGEKSINKVNKVIKFLTIKSYDINTIKDLTDTNCKVYHINCRFKDGVFYVAEDNWTSSRKVVDALSQINQYNRGVNPYVLIHCIDDNPHYIESFVANKAQWCKSFKYIKIC